MAKKIKLDLIDLDVSVPLSENPFLDWTTHLFTADRTQYIIVTNTFSLLSIIFPGRGITGESEFITQTLSMMRQYMHAESFELIFERIIVPNIRQIFLSKSSDRRVTGSMNKLIDIAKYYLLYDDISPYETSRRINEIPMSYLEHATPEEAFPRLKLKS
ncbi:MAG: hypothetical protein JW920_09930 [Deltaproteobacteria bacterium]|nr:hypothetical protein [Deltaproteobacteria bacterium]